MRDQVVINRLRERREDFNDLQKVLVYESVEHEPRHLDKAPNRLSLLKATEDTPVYSVYTNYLAAYEKAKQEFPLEFGVFDIKGLRRQCDIELFWTAQALLAEGITSIPEKLQACAELLRIVLTAPSKDILYKGAVMDMLEKYIPADYYAQQLLKGIYRTAFEYSDLACDWLVETNFDRTFHKAVVAGAEYLNSIKDNSFNLQDFIKENSTAAKADEEFMKKVGKAFSANKTKPAMIAMIYQFKDLDGILDYGYIVSI